ncbi:MAG: flagellar basal body-associated FliL family protein [Nitrospirota bacterium]
MAEKEKEDEKKEGEEAPKKKGGALKWIIISAVLVLVLGGGGAFAYVKFFSHPKGEEGGAAQAAPEKPAKKPDAKLTPEEAKKLAGEMFPLEPFIINLADDQGTRYLKIAMHVELSSPSAKQEAEVRVPQIRDSLLTLLSSKTYEQISSAQGKSQLRSEIIARIDQLLAHGKAKSVYFTDFVIQ